jgi:hypothetical protein
MCSFSDHFFWFSFFSFALQMNQEIFFLSKVGKDSVRDRLTVCVVPITMKPKSYSRNIDTKNEIAAHFCHANAQEQRQAKTQSNVCENRNLLL